MNDKLLYRLQKVQHEEEDNVYSLLRNSSFEQSAPDAFLLKRTKHFLETDK